jgi:DNA-binding HxlR family transcriptional regulator
VKRTIYDQVPPKVVYSLTDYGWSLKPILDAMCSWGEKHIEQSVEPVVSGTVE